MKQLEKFAAMAALEQRDLFKFSTFKFSFGIEPHSNWECCEGDSAERKIWRTAIERDISIPSCVVQLFPCLPSSMLAVHNWIQNYLALHFELAKKERANYKRKSEK